MSQGVDMATAQMRATVQHELWALLWLELQKRPASHKCQGGLSLDAGLPSQRGS